MNRLLNPKLYNVPRFVTSVAAIAADDSAILLSPDENARGIFLARATAFVYRAVAEAPQIALVMGRAKPSTYLDARNWFLAFGMVTPYAYTSPDVTFYAARLEYEPRELRFVPPGYGVFLTSKLALSAVQVAITAEFYFDIEQAGR